MHLRGNHDHISRREILHNEIVSNIFALTDASTVIKAGVYFPLPKQNLDKVIGRAAHLEFIDNTVFIKQFLDYYYQYF